MADNHELNFFFWIVLGTRIIRRYLEGGSLLDLDRRKVNWSTDGLGELQIKFNQHEGNS